MKTTTSRALYGYWQMLRQDRPAPDRRDVKPDGLRDILANTFILEAGDDAVAFPFRLAGSCLSQLYCRDLRGRDFLNLWRGADREAVATLVLAIHEEAAAAVIGYKAHTHRGTSIDVEITLLPLAQEGLDDRFPRILGSASLLSDPYWIGVHPVQRHELTSLRLIWPDEKPWFLRKAQARTAAIHTAPKARHGHLVVYDGGRA